MQRTVFLAAIAMLLLAGMREGNVEQHGAPHRLRRRGDHREEGRGAGAERGGRQQDGSAAEIIKRPEAQALDPTGREPLDDALTCLARTVYWEARGDQRDEHGSDRERRDEPARPRRLPRHGLRVVKQGHEQGQCQFSWWCDGRSDSAFEEDPYKISKEIARRALNLQLTDRNGGRAVFPSPRRQSGVG